MASLSRYSTMTANSLGYNSLATVPSQPSTVGNHKQLFRRSSIASSVTSGASSAYSRNNNITLQSSVSSGGHGGGPTLQGPQGQPQNGLAGALGGSHMQQTSYLDNDAKSTFVRLKQVRHVRTIRINPYFFSLKNTIDKSNRNGTCRG